MDHPKSSCSKECLQCVLAWYNLGSSDNDDEVASDVGETEIDIVVPDSLSPDLIVPESVDVDYEDSDAGSEDSYVSTDPARKDTLEDLIQPRRLTQSDIRFNNYVRRFAENKKKRSRVDDGCPDVGVLADKKEGQPPTASEIRMKEYEERFIRRMKK